MKNIYIQELKSYNPLSELEKVGFDKEYIKHAHLKYETKTLKIFNLQAIEANILKQTALSSNSDCAVHRNVILNASGEFDCLLCATVDKLQIIAEKLQKQPFRLKEVASCILNQLREDKPVINIKNTQFDFQNKKYLMGILNITPDSFSDGGKYFDEKSVISHFLEMIEQGADIIDVGAESTRPNYKEISTDEEISRLKMLFNQDEYKSQHIPVSVDTFNWKTAEYALKNGADIINDISGFSDKNMIKVASDSKKTVVLMFNQKMCEANSNDTSSQMIEFFNIKIDELLSNGVDYNKIILDCGFGFFKDNGENTDILRQLANLQGYKLPILLGISRKSFIKNVVQNMSLDDATCLIEAKYLDYVDILRVHDVLKHKQMLDLFSRL